MKFIGDLMFGGFIIILAVIFLNDSDNAVQLVQGGVKAYTGGVRELATVNK